MFAVFGGVVIERICPTEWESPFGSELCILHLSIYISSVETSIELNYVVEAENHPVVAESL